jgi:hypothetical protein
MENNILLEVNRIKEMMGVNQRLLNEHKGVELIKGIFDDVVGFVTNKINPPSALLSKVNFFGEEIDKSIYNNLIDVLKGVKQLETLDIKLQSEIVRLVWKSISNNVELKTKAYTEFKNSVNFDGLMKKIKEKNEKLGLDAINSVKNVLYDNGLEHLEEPFGEFLKKDYDEFLKNTKRIELDTDITNTLSNSDEIKKFQDWLNNKDKLWYNNSVITSSDSNYGNLDDLTKKAFEKYQKEYLTRISSIKLDIDKLLRDMDSSELFDGKQFFNPGYWVKIDMTEASELFKKIKGNELATKFKQELNEKFYLTDEYYTNIQKMIKLLAEKNLSTDIRVKIEKQLIENFEAVAEVSRDGLKNLIKWVESVRELPDTIVSQKQKQKLNDLLAEIGKNKNISAWLQFKDESTPKGLVGLIWDSFKNSCDTLERITAGSFKIKYDESRVGKGFFGFLRTFFPEKEEVIKDRMSAFESILKSYLTGSKKGFPFARKFFGNKAYDDIIKKNGVKSAYFHYFMTLTFKYAKVSFLAACADYLVQLLGWALKGKEVDECVKAINDLKNSYKKNPQEFLKNNPDFANTEIDINNPEKLPWPEKCKLQDKHIVSKILFVLAWDFTHVDGEYIAGEKDWEAKLGPMFYENLKNGRFWKPIIPINIAAWVFGNDIFKYTSSENLHKLLEISESRLEQYKKDLNTIQEEVKNIKTVTKEKMQQVESEVKEDLGKVNNKKFDEFALTEKLKNLSENGPDENGLYSGIVLEDDLQTPKLYEGKQIKKYYSFVLGKPLFTKSELINPPTTVENYKTNKMKEIIRKNLKFILEQEVNGQQVSSEKIISQNYPDVNNQQVDSNNTNQQTKSVGATNTLFDEVKNMLDIIQVSPNNNWVVGSIPENTRFKMTIEVYEDKNVLYKMFPHKVTNFKTLPIISGFVVKENSKIKFEDNRDDRTYNLKDLVKITDKKYMDDKKKSEEDKKENMYSYDDDELSTDRTKVTKTNSPEYCKKILAIYLENAMIYSSNLNVGQSTQVMDNIRGYQKAITQCSSYNQYDKISLTVQDVFEDRKPPKVNPFDSGLKVLGKIVKKYRPNNQMNWREVRKYLIGYNSDKAYDGFSLKSPNPYIMSSQSLLESTLKSKIKTNLNEVVLDKKKLVIQENLIKERTNILFENTKFKTRKDRSDFVVKLINEAIKLENQGLDKKLIKENFWGVVKSFFGDSGSDSIFTMFKTKMGQWLTSHLSPKKSDGWIGVCIRKTIQQINLRDVDKITDCNFLTREISNSLIKKLGEKMSDEQLKDEGLYDVVRTGMSDNINSPAFREHIEKQVSTMICPVISDLSNKLDSNFESMKKRILEF